MGDYQVTDEKEVKLLNEPFNGVVVSLSNMMIGEIQDCQDNQGQNADDDYDPDHPDSDGSDEVLVEIKYDYEVTDWGGKTQGVDFTKDDLEVEIGNVIRHVMMLTITTMAALHHNEGESTTEATGA